jgi:hypothetical protein
LGGCMLMNSRGGPPFLGCMLMNSRSGPPILRGDPPLGTISMDHTVLFTESTNFDLNNEINVFREIEIRGGPPF